MESDQQIGDHTKVYYDGDELTLEQQHPSDPAAVIVLAPFETLGLLQFIEAQDTLRQQRLAQIRQAGALAHPEWKYAQLYRSWRLVLGEACVYLEPRLFDRGFWAATVTGIGNLGPEDGFPRYYMDLERAKLELQEWLTMRTARYQDNEHDVRNRLHNKVRDVRDALDRIAEHLTGKEVEAIAAAYGAIRQRLAPEVE